MSVSIKPFCRKERVAKNQTTIVQLRVTINRRSRYVSTGIRVLISEWDFEKQEPLASAQHIKYEIFDRINFYQKRIKQLIAFDIEVTLDDLLDDEKATCSQTLAEFTIEVIEQLKRQGKLSSAARYKVILTQLQRLRMTTIIGFLFDAPLLPNPILLESLRRSLPTARLQSPRWRNDVQ